MYEGKMRDKQAYHHLNTVTDIQGAVIFLDFSPIGELLLVENLRTGFNLRTTHGLTSAPRGHRVVSQLTGHLSALILAACLFQTLVVSALSLFQIWGFLCRTFCPFPSMWTFSSIRLKLLWGFWGRFCLSYRWGCSWDWIIIKLFNHCAVFCQLNESTISSTVSSTTTPAG